MTATFEHVVSIIYLHKCIFVCVCINYQTVWFWVLWA